MLFLSDEQDQYTCSSNRLVGLCYTVGLKWVCALCVGRQKEKVH